MHCSSALKQQSNHFGTFENMNQSAYTNNTFHFATIKKHSNYELAGSSKLTADWPMNSKGTSVVQEMKHEKWKKITTVSAGWLQSRLLGRKMSRTGLKSGEDK